MASFKPRVRKQKALRRLQDGQDTSEPSEPGLKHQPKYSAKKQKRFNKYVENKLKKEENLNLLKKLAAAKTDTSLLKSSRNIGTGKGTRRDASEQAAKAEKAGLLPDEGHDSRHGSHDADTPSDSEWSGLSDESSAPASILPTASSIQPPNSAGVGLKRPLEVDPSGAPIIKKRQRLNRRSVNIQIDDFSSDSTGSDSSEPSDQDLGGSSSESESETEQLPASLFAIRRPNATPKPDSRIKDVLEDWSKTASGAHETLSNIEALSRLPESLRTGKTPRQDRASETNTAPDGTLPTTESQDRRIFHVPIERPPSIQEARGKLPVVEEEQKIMEAIHNHPVVVLCGPTGSGKTTQVPQFLFEAGYGTKDSPMPGLIAVTQPRRVAAVTMATRVADEMGKLASRVAYQIRFKSTVTPNCSIKFMTDGVLLRELSDDITLAKYSAIIIDEAHERSVNTDILIGMLSRVVKTRQKLARENRKTSPLKVIIMSATLAASDFVANQHLFGTDPPPLVQVEGRQYDVVEHFARRTERDYLEQAFKKIIRGHKKLPPGSMLVFLTGENEISILLKRLRRTIGGGDIGTGPDFRVSGKNLPLEADDLEIGEEHVEDYGASEHDGSAAEEDTEFDIAEEGPSSSKAVILPLFAKLPTAEQLLVFDLPPEGTRLIILATDVAETSITIPGVRYVFDCGRSKARRISPTGVQSFEIDWISKSSAAQRLGRAGRTAPGHCYRLYSSAVYEAQFPEHSQPKIASESLEDLVLKLKSMQIPGGIASFPFPTPPDYDKVSRAEGLLRSLGALSPKGQITELGRSLELYPISPRFARMLVVGHQNSCSTLATALVAALAIPELFRPESSLDLNDPSSDADEDGVYDQARRLADDARSARRKAYNAAFSSLSKRAFGSDAMKTLQGLFKYLTAANIYHKSISDPSAASNLISSHSPEAECERLFMRPKACAEARNLYHQLLRLVAQNLDSNTNTKSLPKPPTEAQSQMLKQIVVTGFIDQTAMRFDLIDEDEQKRLAELYPHFLEKKSSKAIDVPYVPLFGGEIVAFVHPTSLLAHRSRKEMPPFVVYERLQQSQTKAAFPRTRVFPLTPTTGNVLREFARGTPLLEWGKPLAKVVPLPRRGDRAARKVQVAPFLVNGGEKGARRKRWPLGPAVELVQVQEKSIWRDEMEV